MVRDEAQVFALVDILHNFVIVFDGDVDGIGLFKDEMTIIIITIEDSLLMT